MERKMDFFQLARATSDSSDSGVAEAGWEDHVYDNSVRQALTPLPVPLVEMLLVLASSNKPANSVATRGRHRLFAAQDPCDGKGNRLSGTCIPSGRRGRPPEWAVNGG